jgi:hypothetical protein
VNEQKRDELVGIAADLVQGLLPIIVDAAIAWQGVNPDEARALLRRELVRASANLDEYEKQLDANRAAADSVIEQAKAKP